MPCTWYHADPDAEVLPYTHSFLLIRVNTDRDWPEAGPGEAGPSHVVYKPPPQMPPDPFYLGGGPCGPAEAWRAGGRVGTDPPLDFAPNGVSWCCIGDKLPGRRNLGMGAATLAPGLLCFGRGRSVAPVTGYGHAWLGHPLAEGAAVIEMILTASGSGTVGAYDHGAATLAATLHAAGAGQVQARGQGAAGLGAGLAGAGAGYQPVGGPGAAGLAGSLTAAGACSVPVQGAGAASLSAVLTAAGAGTVSRPAESVYSLHLHGATAHGTVPHHATLNPVGAYTLVGWAKNPTAVTAYVPILSKEDGNVTRSSYYMGFQPAAGGTFYGGHNTGANEVNVASGAVADGAWHHYAMVFTGAGIDLYIDGALAASGGNSTAPLSNTLDLNIGVLPWIPNYLDWRLDDVAFIPSALSGSDIASLAAGTTYPDGYAPGGFWRFESELGGLTPDSSGNANHMGLFPLYSLDADVPAPLA